MLADQSGDFFGTTLTGGGGTACSGYGCGTVFKLASNGTETVLYPFQGDSDGRFPQGSLIADADGNLYGMTSEGGNYNGSPCSEFGCGTVFEVQPNGNKTTLYEFQGGSDGALPVGGVIADASGNLYGTTSSGGGAGCLGGGCGTVFKLTPDGTETVAYAFQGGSDGQFPEAGLIADGAGNLYGTTLLGGASGEGTVFEVSPTGQETVLYSFKGGNDGANPQAPLIMDGKNNFFGTTYGGAGSGCRKNSSFIGCGTVFELSPNGVETVLYSFSKAQGDRPAAGLLFGAHAALYGTTTSGGSHKKGVIFELK